MMLELKQGEVKEILAENSGLIKLRIKSDDKFHRAILYKELLGDIKLGDQVIINTTATVLELGTGGYDFVVCKLKEESKLKGCGHIMKLRYTPYQLKTCAVSESDSPHQQEIRNFTTLDETPVIIGELHSMLPAIVAVLKGVNPKLRISYIMTDGGALPISFSETVAELKSQQLIEQTITIGHAFGGDLEAVNIYSALIAAKEVQLADVIIVIMGPGIVGTATKYGFSGTEQVNILHAADTFSAKTIVVPRISFNDLRSRHLGLSHHSQTVLGQLALVKTEIGLPYLKQKQDNLIKEQLVNSGIKKKHQITYQAINKVESAIKGVANLCNLMGRGFNEECEYFFTCGINGLVAANSIRKE